MSFIERQEGREFARAMFAEISGYPSVCFEKDGITTVLGNLELTVKRYHGDYAAGIEDVLRLAREAVKK